MTKFMIGVVVGSAFGIILAAFAEVELERRLMEECRSKHDVYACELRPVPNPEWVRPNAENT